MELFFETDHGLGNQKGLLPKICLTYPTMNTHGTVITYQKKIQKVHKSRDTPLDFCCHQYFFKESQEILL